MFAHSRLLVAMTLGMGAMAAGVSAPPAGAVARRTFVNWPAYLHGNAHSSDNSAATAITPAKVAGLTRTWTWRPAGPTMPGQPSGLLASPTVVNGRIYIGANTGVFYALDEATGHVIWHRFLGFVPTLTCGKLGIVATATVATDPVTQCPYCLCGRRRWLPVCARRGNGGSCLALCDRHSLANCQRLLRLVVADDRRKADLCRRVIRLR